MNVPLTNIEKIIKYFDGDLNPKEVDEFEDHLLHDKNFQKDFIMVKELLDNLGEPEPNIFNKSLATFLLAFKEHENIKSTIENEMENTKYLYPMPYRWYHKLYKAAAIIIAIIGLTFILFQIVHNRTVNTEKLFTQYYKPYKLNIQSRSVGEHLKNLQRAFDAYSNKDYRLAINYFDSVNLDNTVLFYKGISNIECRKMTVAINCFESELMNPSSMYIAQTHWYLALIYLRLNQISIARIHLKWLVTNIKYNSYYGNLASSILIDLKK